MRMAIGMDIGGTNTKFVLAAEDGTVLSSFQRPTLGVNSKNKEEIVPLLVKSLKEFIAKDRTQAAIGSSALAGIGIGIAGLIDRRNGTVLQSPNITAINGAPLRSIFEQEFKLPIVIENDANIYAYGEKWVGAGKNFNNFVVLTLGTGLGGGYIYNGRLFEGPLEIGHMTIVPNGRYCPCGSYGCLESYASGRAIIDRAVSSLEKGTESLLMKCCEGNIYKITPETVFKNALDGDSLSREIYREAGQFLGMGIANLINLLGIEAVIIGGGLLGAWDLLVEEIKKESIKRALKHLASDVQIIKSELTKDAGSIGAAGLLFSKITEADSCIDLSAN
ncbi:MAG: ROK family protein [Nitrospira sp.]|nr:ROK family protein [bacterium]MBL7049686.1 ROK family protein [Nitrospira sp.]